MAVLDELAAASVISDTADETLAGSGSGSSSSEAHVTGASGISDQNQEHPLDADIAMVQQVIVHGL